MTDTQVDTTSFNNFKIVCVYVCVCVQGFPGGSAVKNPPAKQETWVRSLGWEDPLEKEMTTQSSILAWAIPWTEEGGGLQSWVTELDTMIKQQQQQIYVFFLKK